DHIPPPLLQQLKNGGIMVIPIGPPGAQHLLKVVKEQGADGQIMIRRTDIYNGRPVPFVPFTKLEGETIKGTHNARSPAPCAIVAARDDCRRGARSSRRGA